MLGSKYVLLLLSVLIGFGAILSLKDTQDKNFIRLLKKLEIRNRRSILHSTCCEQGMILHSTCCEQGIIKHRNKKNILLLSCEVLG